MTRTEARKHAYQRAGGRCQWPTCRRVLSLQTDNEFTLAHAHELVWRSRGGDPTDPAIILILCHACHHGLHMRIGGKIKRIKGTKAEGPLRFFERRGREWIEVTGVGSAYAR